MPQPLIQTGDAFQESDQVRKFEYLSVPNIVADYHLNHGGEVLLQSVVKMWDNVVGLLRLRGLYKAYRTASEGRSATGYITVPRPESIGNGETFTLVDGVNPAKTFEYRKTAGGTPGNVTILLTIAAGGAADAVTDTDVMNLTIQAINAAAPLNITAVTAAVINGMPAGGELFLSNDVLPASVAAAEAQNVRITDTVADERFVTEGMAGALHRAATGRINVPAPADLVDGDFFTIPGAVTKVYEFDRNNDGVALGRVLVDVNPPGVTTDVQVAAAVVTAVNSQTGTTGVSAVSDPVRATGYVTALPPALLADGDLFTLNDGVNPAKTFEFDTDSVVGGGNVQIDISAAVTMVDVRNAIISAVNGAAALDITASNPGVGPRVTLTADTAGAAANQSIIAAVANLGFEYAGMSGGSQSVKLTQANAGTAYNGTITESVASALFSVSGMSGGMDAGWDVTDGHCAFAGYDIHLSGIPRVPAVVGVENHLKVRVTETKYTLETDPDIIKVTLPGVIQTLSGPNQIRWAASVLVEDASAPPPALASSPRQEMLITDAFLAQPDSVTGQTILGTTQSVNGYVISAVNEVPVRVRKFGMFVEPIDFSLVVLKTGSSSVVGSGGMTGQLTVAPITPTHHAIIATGPADAVGVWAKGGLNREGLLAEGGSLGPASVIGDSRTNDSGHGVVGYGADAGAGSSGGWMEGGGSTGPGLFGLGSGGNLVGVVFASQGLIGKGGAAGGYGVEGRGTSGFAGVRGVGGSTGRGVEGFGQSGEAGVFGQGGTSTGSRGVQGQSTADSGTGVYGYASGSGTVIGVYGVVDAAAYGYGVYGLGGGFGGAGVRGEAGAGSGDLGGRFLGDGLGYGGESIGGAGHTTGTTAAGFVGRGGFAGGIGLVGFGVGNSPSVFGVKGSTLVTLGEFTAVELSGVAGVGTGTGSGVIGLGPSATASPGVKGIGQFGAAPGVSGYGGPTAGPGLAGFGGTGGDGVYGLGEGSAPGVRGVGGASGPGVYGTPPPGSAHPGVYGRVVTAFGNGVYGDAGLTAGGLASCSGVRGMAGAGASAGVSGYADHPSSWAGLFQADDAPAVRAESFSGSAPVVHVLGAGTGPAGLVERANPQWWLRNSAAAQVNDGMFAFGRETDVGPEFALRYDAVATRLKLTRNLQNGFGAHESVMEFLRDSREFRLFTDPNYKFNTIGAALVAGPTHHIEAGTQKSWIFGGLECFCAERGGAPGAADVDLVVMPGVYLDSKGTLVRVTSLLTLRVVDLGLTGTLPGTRQLSNAALGIDSAGGAPWHAYVFHKSSIFGGAPQLGFGLAGPDIQGRHSGLLDPLHVLASAGYTNADTRYVGVFYLRPDITQPNQALSAYRYSHSASGLRRVHNSYAFTSTTSPALSSAAAGTFTTAEFSIARGNFPITAKEVDLTSRLDITNSRTGGASKSYASLRLRGPNSGWAGPAPVPVVQTPNILGHADGAMDRVYNTVAVPIGDTHGLYADVELVVDSFGSGPGAGSVSASGVISVYSFLEDLNDFTQVSFYP